MKDFDILSLKYAVNGAGGNARLTIFHNVAYNDFFCRVYLSRDKIFVVIL